MPRTHSQLIHPIEVPTPFSVGPVYTYLIAADPLTLVDSGLDLPESRQALVAGLAARGVAPGDVRRVVLTHGHVDHVGLAGWFQELGAEVWLHPLDAGKVLLEDWWLAGRDELMDLCGVPGRVQEMMVRLYDMALRMVRPLHRPLRPLEGGSPIPFDGFDLEVLYTPGHCLGHVSLWWPETGTLLGGDLLLQEVSPNPLAEPLPGGSHALTLGQFLDSLALAETLPAARVLPGHGPVITDPGPVIAGYRAHHERRLGHVHAALPPGGATVYDLTRKLYPRVSDPNLFLALSEVLAHLELLEQQGRAVAEPGPAGRLFRPR